MSAAARRYQPFLEIVPRRYFRARAAGYDGFAPRGDVAMQHDRGSADRLSAIRQRAAARSMAGCRSVTGPRLVRQPDQHLP